MKMSFFKLGEVRVACDEDFKYLLGLVDDNTNWQQEYMKHDTAVYSKETDVTSFRMVKLTAKVKDVPGAILYDVLHDPEYRRVWDKSMIEGFEICHINPNNDIGYYALRSIPPFKNRDFVTQRSWLETKTEYVIFNHSVFHESCPLKKNFIRGISYLTGYVIRPTGPSTCTLTYIAQVDPRGKLPSWAVNKATQYIAPRVLTKLVKAARNYESWKKKHNPDFKPWIYPEQIEVPRINWSQIQTVPDISLDSILDESSAVEVKSEQERFDSELLGNGGSGCNSPAVTKKELSGTKLNYAQGD